MDNFLYKILDKLNMGVIVVNCDQNIVIWNSWLERFTGKSEASVLDKKLISVCPRFSEMRYQNILWRALFKGQKRFCSGTLHKNFIEPVATIEDRGVLRQNLLVEPLEYEGENFVMLQIIDVSTYHTRLTEVKTFIKSLEQEYEEVKEAEKKNRQLAHYDSLTGLPNRLFLMEKLFLAMNSAKINKESIAVMFVDIDDFKKINDTYGHETGDKLLIAISQRLNKNLRSIDTLARLAGDEFVIVLAQIKESKGVEQIAQKIKQSFDFPFSIEANNIDVGLSIGISIYPEDGEDIDKLIRNADFAMYNAKKAGKKDYKFFTS